MSKKRYIFFFVVCLISVSSVYAQEGDSSTPFINYTDDVLRYSLEYPTYDAVSLVMPAVSQPAGFGTFQENPAAMALFDKSYFSFDLSSRFVNETSSYLDNESDFSDNQTSIGDLGLIYKIPTTRGSLVIGGGYSQTTDFNRALSATGRNNSTTITDFYNSSDVSDSLFFAAFDAYAIDYASADNSYDDTESIFRTFDNPGDYSGINQDVELTERGQMGKYSAFFATEFSKNLFFGASIGFLQGSYALRLDFLESDRLNDYDAALIDSDDDGEGDTGVDNILSFTSVDATIQAFSARLGLIYKPTAYLSIGGSYEFPSKLRVDEDYNTEITNTLDNGVQYADDVPGAYSYSITRPQRLKAGLTIINETGLTLSASAEGVRYSEGRIEFDELKYNADENIINSTVESVLRDVINLRGGLQYDINNRFTPRVGYAYHPSPQNGFSNVRQFISGGFSAVLTPGLMLDFGLQYSFWDDQNTLYQTPTASEVVREEVSRINMMVGLRMTL